MITLCLAVVQTFSVMCRAKMYKKLRQNCSDVECTKLRTPQLRQEQHAIVRFHYLLNKKSPTQTYAAMKEGYGEQTLARSTIFHLHQQFTQERVSASPKSKSGRLVAASTETTVNTIGTMLEDDDSLSQWQIALVRISQTTVKNIILSFLSCNFHWGVCLRFYVKRSYGHSVCIIGLIFSLVL